MSRLTFFKKNRQLLFLYYFWLVTIVVVVFLGLSFVSQARAAIVVGDLRGNITLQFVYDYECPYCHHLYQALQQVLDHEKHIKVKLYPVAVINQTSLMAATAAIVATHYPNAFIQYTNMLMLHSPLSPPEIWQVLNSRGLNKPAFLQDMHSFWVKDQLLEGLTLLHKYHVKSVPLLIISTDHGKSTALMGEQTPAALEKAIQHIRTASPIE